MRYKLHCVGVSMCVIIILFIHKLLQVSKIFSQVSRIISETAECPIRKAYDRERKQSPDARNLNVSASLCSVTEI